MEHLAIDTYFDTIIKLINITKYAIFFNISCRSAVHTLPDGTNCHTLVKGKDWWTDEITRTFGSFGFEIKIKEFGESNKNLVLFLKKNN